MTQIAMNITIFNGNTDSLYMAIYSKLPEGNLGVSKNGATPNHPRKMHDNDLVLQAFETHGDCWESLILKNPCF